MRKYTMNIDSEKCAKAYGYELHCSPKDSTNIAYAIKGMMLEDAKKYLEDVIALKKSVPAVYHNQKIHHRRGIGPGSYPEKAARCMLKILKNAENNAEYKGLDAENMKIKHVATYRGREIKAYMPRAHGRATDKNEQTTNIEIILEETEVIE
ncbi:MAG: 50S ribosomal protein L22 [Candidatus Thermoplasmatota archaeon]